MKQNITVTANSLDKGVKKMLSNEYKYDQDFTNVVTKTLYGVNWLSKNLKETKFWLKFKIDKISNHDYEIMKQYYPWFSTSDDHILFDCFMLTLLGIVEHFVWSNELYL